MTEKRRDLFNYVRNKEYNIICLQDVHINAQLEPFIKSEWGYEVFFSSFTNILLKIIEGPMLSIITLMHFV